MPRFTEAFDPSGFTLGTSRDILPPGQYLAQIVRSQTKRTRDGNGQYLELKLSVMEGEYADHHLFVRLNLVNDNARTVDFANRALAAICRATGVMNLLDSSELHGKPMAVQVTVRPAGPDKKGIMREAQNEVRDYAPGAALVQPARLDAVSAVALHAPTLPASPPPAALIKRPARWSTATA